MTNQEQLNQIEGLIESKRQQLDELDCKIWDAQRDRRYAMSNVEYRKLNREVTRLFSQRKQIAGQIADLGQDATNLAEGIAAANRAEERRAKLVGAEKFVLRSGKEFHVFSVIGENEVLVQSNIAVATEYSKQGARDLWRKMVGLGWTKVAA